MSVGPAMMALLAALGLIGGVGITALGPGGVLATIGLFVVTDLSPAEVAGTAIVTHIATGLLGTAAYLRSGQLREPVTRRTALLLAGSAVVGTPIGIGLNAVVSSRAFGIVLGVFLAVVAVLVWYRTRTTGSSAEHHHPQHATAVVAMLGGAVAAASGLVGVGGPLLAVPLLVAIGVPLLPALGAAQAQSVIIATVGTLGYVAQGAIDWPLAALVGIPEMVGVLLGWRLARRTPPIRLKYALVAVLLALAPYVALSG